MGRRSGGVRPAAAAAASSLSAADGAARSIHAEAVDAVEDTVPYLEDLSPSSVINIHSSSSWPAWVIDEVDDLE